MLDNFWDRFNDRILIIFLEALHSKPGSVGNEIDKIPPFFSLLIISIINSSGLFTCSNTWEIIILSKKASSKGKFFPSYLITFSRPAFFK